MQNIIDFAFIVLSTVYFTLRVKEELIDGRTDSVLPSETNKTPNFFMAYNVFMTMGIVALSMVKVLFYLRVN